LIPLDGLALSIKVVTDKPLPHDQSCYAIDDQTKEGASSPPRPLVFDEFVRPLDDFLDAKIVVERNVVSERRRQEPVGRRLLPILITNSYSQGLHCIPQCNGGDIRVKNRQ
jgi:hypothetical protein